METMKVLLRSSPKTTPFSLKMGRELEKVSLLKIMSIETSMDGSVSLNLKPMTFWQTIPARWAILLRRDIRWKRSLEELLSVDTIRKTFVNLCHGEEELFNSQDIPRLLETIFHDFVIEETYEACKRYKHPTINFKMLKKFVNIKIKGTIPEAFGGIPIDKGY